MNKNKHAANMRGVPEFPFKHIPLFIDAAAKCARVVVFCKTPEHVGHFQNILPY